MKSLASCWVMHLEVLVATEINYIHVVIIIIFIRPIIVIVIAF